ncbi:hypothetical protein PSTG_19286, partial [Puccinia striiformis f. sp. tritici PST-78]
VRLALDSKPVTLKHFVVTNLSDPQSSLEFPDVLLRIGPVSGDYDLILGTPFLDRFNLDVSIHSHAVFRDTAPLRLLDYRLQQGLPSIASITDIQKDYPCKASEEAILKEFDALFPQDIPAISDDAEEAGLFTDGTFPEKLQPVESNIRHRIILSNPDAAFNEK